MNCYLTLCVDSWPFSLLSCCRPFLFFPADDDDDEAGPDKEDDNAGPDHDYFVVPIIVNIIIHLIVTL